MDDDVSVLVGNGDGSFEPYGRLPAGEGPISVAMGDLNGDGALDLAVAEEFSDDVRVWLGKGDGSFSAASRYDAGSGPSYVTMGDLDRDGALDLVVANFDAASVLLGHGDGSFAPRVDYMADDGWPSCVSPGDMDGDGDGDGDLDLVVIFHDITDIFVYGGLGDGSFATPARYHVPHANVAPDVFYHIHVEEPTGLHLHLTGDDGWDTYLYVLAGECAEEEVVACNDDFPRVGQSQLDVILDPGDFWIMVAGFGEGDSGPFTLEIELFVPSPPPDNDTCEAAQPVDPELGPIHLAGTTRNAGVDLEAGCGQVVNRARDVFYSLHLEEPATLHVHLSGERGWDTVLYLLSGECGEELEVTACNDDDPVVGESDIVVALEAGDYWIAVAGYLADAYGPFDLLVELERQ